jgi:hypothetical protein
MKHLFIAKMKSLRTIGAAFFLSGIFTAPVVSNALIIFPSNPDLTYQSFTGVGTGVPIYTLNADMLEVPSGHLTAVVCDLYGTAEVSIKIKDESSGNTASTTIAAKVESKPDVVLASIPGNTSDYFLGVVYEDMSGFVVFRTYKITNVGLSTMAITYQTSATLSGTTVGFPHIDMLPDYDNLINGLPSLHRFAITYSDVGGIKEEHGDISAPTVFSAVTSIPGSSSYGFGGDIALSFDPVSKKVHEYITYSNNASLMLTELVTSYAAGPYASPSVAGATTLIAGPINTMVPLPRIEAIGTNAIGSGLVPWVVAVSVGGEVWEYTPMTHFDCSVGINTTDRNICQAVTAGPGLPSGNLCNSNYNIGWHNKTYGYLTQVIDATTGLISTTYPNYYIANTPAVIFPSGDSKIPIAVTSCSNSGNYLFTGFWDGGSNIKYHLKAGIASYKPGGTTGVNVVDVTNQIKVYPNPVADKMVISGLKIGTFNIINVAGQVIKTGVINQDNYGLDLSALRNGNYVLSLQSIDGYKNFKFIKQ